MAEGQRLVQRKVMCEVEVVQHERGRSDKLCRAAVQVGVGTTCLVQLIENREEKQQKYEQYEEMGKEARTK